MSQRRSREQWRTLIDEQSRSGQSAAAFCRERGINPKYFSKRRKDLDASGDQAGFVQVIPRLAAQSAPLRLVVGGAALEIPAQVSPQWLGQLLQVLGSESVS